MIRKEIGDYIICPLFVPAQREPNLSQAAGEGITMPIFWGTVATNLEKYFTVSRKIRESRVKTLPMKTVNVSP